MRTPHLSLLTAAAVKSELEISIAPHATKRREFPLPPHVLLSSNQTNKPHLAATLLHHSCELVTHNSAWQQPLLSFMVRVQVTAARGCGGVAVDVGHR
jgi:hypothetical protein